MTRHVGGTEWLRGPCCSGSCGLLKVPRTTAVSQSPPKHPRHSRSISTRLYSWICGVFTVSWFWEIRISKPTPLGWKWSDCDLRCCVDTLSEGTTNKQTGSSGSGHVRAALVALRHRTELLVVGLRLFGESSNEALRSPVSSNRGCKRQQGGWRKQKTCVSGMTGDIRSLWSINEGNVFNKMLISSNLRPASKVM